MGISCALTFDFDAMSLWIGSYKTLNPATVSRGEFGAVAVPRILDLLKRHDVPATFYIPGHTALVYPDLVRRIAAEGHEIGHHGWVHENPAEFDEAGERHNLDRGLEVLHDVAGIVPLGYRSPAWSFSENTARLLLEYGFVYDSSLMGGDFTPYYIRAGDRYDDKSPYVFGTSVDVLELPVSWVLDDFPHFEFDGRSVPGLSAPSKVEAIWQDEFAYAHRNVPGGLFSLTMHPQVIGRGHRLMMLDRLIDRFKGAPEVKFVRMIDYAARWREAYPLAATSQKGTAHAPA